jgi:hypothetical protein
VYVAAGILLTLAIALGLLVAPICLLIACLALMVAFSAHATR